MNHQDEENNNAYTIYLTGNNYTWRKMICYINKRSDELLLILIINSNYIFFFYKRSDV